MRNSDICLSIRTIDKNRTAERALALMEALQPTRIEWSYVTDRELIARFREIAPVFVATLNTISPAGQAGGLRLDGGLRIQSPEDLGVTRWRAVMNGVELTETDDRSEPYHNPYSPLLGTPEQHRAWIVPADLCKDGFNTIEITLADGSKPVPVVFLDVAMPVQGSSCNDLRNNKS